MGYGGVGGGQRRIGKPAGGEFKLVSLEDGRRGGVSRRDVSGMMRKMRRGRGMMRIGGQRKRHVVRKESPSRVTSSQDGWMTRSAAHRRRRRRRRGATKSRVGRGGDAAGTGGRRRQRNGRSLSAVTVAVADGGEGGRTRVRQVDDGRRRRRRKIAAEDRRRATELQRAGRRAHVRKGAARRQRRDDVDVSQSGRGQARREMRRRPGRVIVGFGHGRRISPSQR